MIKKTKIIKPLGKTSPWGWGLEPTHGCNLKCGHCSCRLLPDGEYHFMDEDTWRSAWNIIGRLTPTSRVDLCIGGEPTLNPDIVRFLKIARKISPYSQIQITTNGTMIYKSKLKIEELINAGANIIYIDMYGSKKKFIELAKNSGFPFYEYYEKPKNAPSPWTYYGPHLQLVVLQEQPENWPDSRKRSGLLGTWYNNLDWEAAKAFNLSPVITPPARRCNQPFLYSMVTSSGHYILCCQDNMAETSGMFGSVHDGIEGFRNFWYGLEMQTIRRRLREKNREDTLFACNKCCITFSRCDYRNWTDHDVSYYWNGSSWKEMPPAPESLYRFNNLEKLKASEE